MIQAESNFAESMKRHRYFILSHVDTQFVPACWQKREVYGSPRSPPLPLLPISEQADFQTGPAPSIPPLSEPVAAHCWGMWGRPQVRGFWEAASFPLFPFHLSRFLCPSTLTYRQQKIKDAGWVAPHGCLNRGNESHRRWDQPCCFVNYHQPHPDVAISDSTSRFGPEAGQELLQKDCGDS